MTEIFLQLTRPFESISGGGRRAPGAKFTGAARAGTFHSERSPPPVDGRRGAPAAARWRRAHRRRGRSERKPASAARRPSQRPLRGRPSQRPLRGGGGRRCAQCAGQAGRQAGRRRPAAPPSGRCAAASAAARRAGGTPGLRGRRFGRRSRHAKRRSAEHAASTPTPRPLHPPGPYTPLPPLPPAAAPCPTLNPFLWLMISGTVTRCSTQRPCPPLRAEPPLSFPRCPYPVLEVCQLFTVTTPTVLSAPRGCWYGSAVGRWRQSRERKSCKFWVEVA